MRRERRVQDNRDSSRGRQRKKGRPAGEGGPSREAVQAVFFAAFLAGGRAGWGIMKLSP